MSEISESPLEQTVEIPLEYEILSVICRRSRRRLRDIQSSSQASLKLDRSRGLLQVKGTPDAINDVRNQLQMLAGPSVSVTAAVWAELMRTRTNPEPSQAAVARIQQQSGCRIHIERGAQQVRLFGSNPSIAIAQDLLNILTEMCVEERVVMECPLYLDMQMLQTFAQEFAVTLQVEEKQINVIGVAGAVSEASRELKNYDTDEKGIEVSNTSNASHTAVREAMVKLKADGDVNYSSEFSEQVPADIDSTATAGVEPLMQGAVLSKLPPPSPVKDATQQKSQRKHLRSTEQQQSQGACPTCGCSANFCVQCGSATAKLQAPGAGAPGCPTCGAVKFCIYCGHPTEKNYNGAKVGYNGVPRPVYKPPVTENFATYADKMPMMPMQFAQAGVRNYPSIVQTPEGAMMMCLPVGGPGGGIMAPPMMAAGPWMSGMNMMPMSFS